MYAVTSQLVYLDFCSQKTILSSPLRFIVEFDWLSGRHKHTCDKFKNGILEICRILVFLKNIQASFELKCWRFPKFWLKRDVFEKI